ncbi:MAG: hypothetical protein JWN87_1328 [Frankiales bacterium]|nr:hypothetical protein [Frankiales bacterium]
MTGPRSWRFVTAVLDEERLRAFSALVRDPNPVHIDPAFARGLGLPGAIAQGGLVVSALSAMLNADGIVQLDVRLLAPVPAGTALVCQGTAGEQTPDGQVHVECEVSDGADRVFARAVALVGSRVHA